MSRNLPDLYAVVDVGQDASEAEIRRAFRRAAWRWHPDLIAGRLAAAAAAAQVAAAAAAAAADAAQIGVDVEAGYADPAGRGVGDAARDVWQAVAEAEARFKELTAAYSVLRDPQRRAAYDLRRARVEAARDAASVDDDADVVDAIVISEVIEAPDAAEEVLLPEAPGDASEAVSGDADDADPDVAAARTAEVLRGLLARRKRERADAAASGVKPVGRASPPAGADPAPDPPPPAPPAAVAPAAVPSTPSGPTPGMGRIVRPRRPVAGPPDMLGWAMDETPLGLAIVVCADEAVCAVQFVDDGAVDAYTRSLPRRFGAPAMPDDPTAVAVFGQIADYFAGRRRRFEIGVRLVGVPAFRAELLTAMRRLAYGRTASLADVGDLVGKPVATRAVAEACAQNPLPLLIPSHRVVMPNGRVAADSAQRSRTEFLLDLERRAVAARRSRPRPPGAPGPR